MTLRDLVASSQSIEGQLSMVRKAYTAGSIPNTVPDGNVSFPSEPEEVKSGIELEFRCALCKRIPLISGMLIYWIGMCHSSTRMRTSTLSRISLSSCSPVNFALVILL